MKRITVHFSGRVQGVGFRYTTERVAGDFAVTGYVKNLSDGRVKVVADGESQEIDRFLEAVQEAMAGFIRHTDVTESTGDARYAQFGVAFLDFSGSTFIR